MLKVLLIIQVKYGKIFLSQYVEERKMNEVKRFLNSPFIKMATLSLLTLGIGGICSALGTWDFSNDKNIGIKLTILIMLVVVYVVLLAFYSTYETNINKISSLYARQNETFEEVMSGLMNLCRKSAGGSNKVIKSIVEKKSANLELWSFDEASFWMCKNIYDTLCKIGSGKEFEVIYDRLDETEKPEKYIYTNSYANKNMNRPTVYNTKRSIEQHTYHDTELFRKNESEVEVIIGSDEIDKCFEHEDNKKRHKNKNKYNQYIAIPVFCNDDKMVGLFEIVCLNKTFLSEKESDIREIISRYFVPYAYFALLLNKLEKALIAQPK